MADIRILIKRESEQAVVAETSGLRKLGYPEFLLEFTGTSLIDEAKAFLLYLSECVLRNTVPFRTGETIAYGYWVVRFADAEGNKQEIWEYNPLGTGFIKGATLALFYSKEQHAVCNVLDTDFSPPKPDQLSVISEGVFEGLAVQGVRYPSPTHMSGWWITTDKYDGNIRSLKNEHTYHLTAARPELAKYLALPVGFRFDFTSSEDVWFEERIAKGLE